MAECVFVSGVPFSKGRKTFRKAFPQICKSLHYFWRGELPDDWMKKGGFSYREYVCLFPVSTKKKPNRFVCLCGLR